MGSLEGHLLPGTFIMCFGIWWTYALFDRYFRCLAEKSRFQCSSSYSSKEGWFKVIVNGIGMFGEFYTALDSNYKFIHIGNSQHISMYLFFFINGIVDILVNNGYPLPEGTDYMSFTLAVGVEALLFCFHLHGRTALDIHVHTLLIIAVMASIGASLTEWRFRDNMLSGLFRALCAIVQGTWFYTVGFVLYPPFSSHAIEESHDRMMLLTSLFCWQIAASLVFMIFIGFCFHVKYRPILRINETNWNNRMFGAFSDIDCLRSEQYSRIDSKMQFKPSESDERLKNSLISTSDEDN